MQAAPSPRDAAAPDGQSGEQELSRALIIERSYGAAPEEALVIDVSALRLVDPSPLARFCAQLQIVNLRSNMIVKLPGARHFAPCAC